MIHAGCDMYIGNKILISAYHKSKPVLSSNRMTSFVFQNAVYEQPPEADNRYISCLY